MLAAPPDQVAAGQVGAQLPVGGGLPVGGPVARQDSEARSPLVEMTVKARDNMLLLTPSAALPARFPSHGTDMRQVGLRLARRRTWGKSDMRLGRRDMRASHPATAVFRYLAQPKAHVTVVHVHRYRCTYVRFPRACGR